jgi:hypothetical protein
MSTFGSDAAERAVKSTLAGGFSFAFSDTVSHWHSLHLEEQAILWAVGCTAFSLLMSWASRRFGTPGTASLTRKVHYDD